MTRLAAAICLAWLTSAFAAEPAPSAPGRVLTVGPGQQYVSIADAARAARDGDTVEIAAGEYRADVAVWTQKHVTIRAVQGRARLVADGAAAEGKAIWVMRGGEFVVENIDFTGARVRERNGAGIRFESGRLMVRNCTFTDNENGILTAGDENAALEIDRSEFGHSGAGDGYSHNLYAGTIRKLSVTRSYFHHARTGHLLKSRARENDIRYNRLTDETGGRASYELEFPSGGVAYVVGNIVQQSGTTENPIVVSFGGEGYRWPRSELYLVHNTLVDDRGPPGTLLRIAPGADRVVVANNLTVGGAELAGDRVGHYTANFNVRPSDLARGSAFEYRLPRNSGLLGRAVPIAPIDGVSLTPLEEYAHPLNSRPLAGLRLSPGALQQSSP
ncbi:MAG TPA: hypothetical protein VHP37_24510 [Burkholderiales bacterium]|nr:hypothetical protein [Burkholderiales bacterium]